MEEAMRRGLLMLAVSGRSGLCRKGSSPAGSRLDVAIRCESVIVSSELGQTTIIGELTAIQYVYMAFHGEHVAEHTHRVPESTHRQR